MSGYSRQADEFQSAAHEDRTGLVTEFWSFLKYNKKWWLLPILLAMLAIAEFNTQHANHRISQIHGLRHTVPERFFNDAWVEKMFITHLLDHQLYGVPDGLVRPRQERELADHASGALT